MNLLDDEGNPLQVATAENAMLRDEDKWIISRVNEATADITNSLEKFELGLAGQKVYELIWDEYCDWYIELVKARLWSDDEEDKATARFVLQSVLKDYLNCYTIYALLQRKYGDIYQQNQAIQMTMITC